MLLPSIFGNDFFDDFEKSFPLRMNWGRETDTLGGLMRADVKESKDENEKFIRRERYMGSVSRSFYVGKTLSEEDIKAKFDNGTLILSLPKVPEKKVEEDRYIAIEG